LAIALSVCRCVKKLSSSVAAAVGTTAMDIRATGPKAPSARLVIA
jgi:hypothetical protein